ncbi:MAG: phenylalanine--tRNA ligase subunit beta [Synergistetes bacterium]|nr:phenylalanine--tRNA ligase subunit beta [Synergistota bacterium]
MRLSFKWLNEFIDVGFSPEALADKLLMVGLEVEEVERLNPGISGLVAARVRKTERFESGYSVHLSVGDKIYFAFYDGETPPQTGEMVVIAPAGSSIPGGGMVREYSIAGSSFNAILPSEERLGIGEEGGFIRLPESVSEGEDFVKLYELDDVILDISITPNRGDCLSMLGVAREVAAIKGMGPANLLPKFDLEEEGEDIRDLVSVEVQDYELCPRYVGRVIENVKVGESPLWLKRRLIHCGLRPVNNVVDITNYVMLELGQPLHAFDLDLIRGKKIIIRKALEGEKLICIDGVERRFTPENLLIADVERPIAIAGVIGGEETEIWSGTKNVFLESAFFNPSSVRMTARYLGVSTEASYRFERRVDPGNTLFSADRAAYLISKIASGKVARGYFDLSKETFRSWYVMLRPGRVNKILGTQLRNEEIITILSSLGFASRYREDLLEVEIPTYRGDIQREIDLIEEVARIYGYVKIPARMPWGETQVGGMSEAQKLEWKVRDILVGSGLTEVITYSFIDPSIFDALLLPEGHRLRKVVKLKNPLRENQSVMRTFMLPGLFSVLLTNYRRGLREMSLFEIGRIFITDLTPEGLPTEKTRIGFIMLGGVDKELITGCKIPRDFLNLKGAVENLFDALKIEGYTFEELKEDLPFLSRYNSSSISIGGKAIGWIGELSPKIRIEHDIEEAVYIAELDFDLLLSLVSREIRYKGLPKFPAVRRDVSVIVPLEGKAAEVERIIRQTGGEMVEEVRVFDFYQGPQIPQGYRSLAFSVIYRLRDRTLKDEEVDVVHSKVRESLRQAGFEVR